MFDETKAMTQKVDNIMTKVNSIIQENSTKHHNLHQSKNYSKIDSKICRNSQEPMITRAKNNIN